MRDIITIIINVRRQIQLPGAAAAIESVATSDPATYSVLAALAILADAPAAAAVPVPTQSAVPVALTERLHATWITFPISTAEPASLPASAVAAVQLGLGFLQPGTTSSTANALVVPASRLLSSNERALDRVCIDGSCCSFD
jgi:hypothetical protein